MRLIHDGDEYTIDEDVNLVEKKRTKEPSVDIQGEPWGWTKPGRKPIGFREDGNYDGTH